ncbi:patatin-like phospholipase family protein [Pirellulaceae bacterium SH501]
MNDHTPERSCNDPGFISLPERWFKNRYGFSLLFALLFWPLLSFVPSLESIVVNGLLLDRYWQLAYLTITNDVAFFFAISILRVLGTRNPGGWLSRFLFGVGSASWGWKRVGCVALLSMITPLFIASMFGSEFSGTDFWHYVFAVLTVGLSAAIGVAGLWMIGFVKCWIFGSHEESANYFPFESRSTTGFLCLHPPSRSLESFLGRVGLGNTDLQFLMYFVLMATVHYQISLRFETEDYWFNSAPSSVILLLSLVFMFLSGLANWLDRWRIPTLFVFVLSLTLLVSLRGSTRLLKSFPDTSSNRFIDRVSEVRERENELYKNDGLILQRRQLTADETASLDADAWRAIQNRLSQLDQYENEKGKTLVVVTCPGGGIHAAAWASCVLDQLSDEYIEFKDSVCVISGVSGGSVGALLFVGSRYENELLDRFVVGATRPSTEDVHRELLHRSPALELSTRSALEAIAFGAAVDDFYGLIGVPGAGRGQRLEDSLNARLSMDIQSMTIGQWGDRALAGKVPVVIFNSTDAVTGRRILFDTIPTPRRASNVGLKARPLNYRELLSSNSQAFDLLPATAARTSATFPYVSPFTKPDKANAVGAHVAICDGGYVDNEGIVTAVNWVEFLLRRWVSEDGKERAFDRILLLRIEPSSVEDNNEVATSTWFLETFRWLLGPGETMANVRSSSQIERGNLETDLVSLYLKINAQQGSPQGIDEPLELGTKSDGNPAQEQNVVDVPAFDKRQHSKAEIRQNWEQMLDKFQATGDVPFTPRQSNLPQATIDEGGGGTRNEPPVIVQSITYKDANQSIPLNWKLSNRQKLGYLMAWKLCSSDGTQLRETLDRYFHRVEKQDEE